MGGVLEWGSEIEATPFFNGSKVVLRSDGFLNGQLYDDRRRQVLEDRST